MVRAGSDLGLTPPGYGLLPLRGCREERSKRARNLKGRRSVPYPELSSREARPPGITKGH
jgi:hypothetical protein